LSCSYSNRNLHNENKPTSNPSREVEETASNAREPSERSEIHSSRFIGDLNPQGVFIEATSAAERDSSHRGGVGVWHPKDISNETINLTSNGFSAASQLGGYFQSNSLVRESLSTYLQTQFLHCAPPTPHFNALKDIYLRKVHPIFPILDQWNFSVDDVSPSTTIMKQALCLAASTNWEAAPHLRLGSDGPLLTHQEFSRRLSATMRSAIDFGLVTDKLVLIRALAVLSLFMQTSNNLEEDLPALLSSRAIHHMQTLGLHQLRAGQDSDTIETLFCALWTLDRLTAAFYGRPVVLHENDIGRDLDACTKKQEPCFRLFLMVVRWLDKVISLYRPNSTTSVTQLAIEMPDFEDMIVAAETTRVPDTILGMSISLLLHSFTYSRSNNRNILPRHLYPLMQGCLSRLLASVSRATLFDIQDSRKVFRGSNHCHSCKRVPSSNPTSASRPLRSVIISRIRVSPTTT
jgi:hypothetical protein